MAKLVTITPEMRGRFCIGRFADDAGSRLWLRLGRRYFRITRMSWCDETSILFERIA